MKTCKICLTPLREGSDGRLYHQVTRNENRDPVKHAEMDFKPTEVVPGIDYAQVETLCKEEVIEQ